MSSSGNGLQGFALNDLWRALPAHVSPQRLVLAAFVCLLIAAAALRFYGLTGNSAWYDEAVVANNSRATLSEVVPNTRDSNSSPILYPLALWAVQKVDVSVFSIRVLPAMASVLTVAVMLFLLPRLGVARGTAFLAALLTTLSVAAIQHAQDAREYSIDALLAALMTAGLLWYLRDGRKALLCASLFLAPLLQYGLVLFGAAVIAAAMLLTPPTIGAPEGNSHPNWIRNWIEQRIALLWPAACFLTGCAISYATTLRYQWQEGGFASGIYLSPYYYQEKFDAAAIFEFSIDRIWSLLTYHMPHVVAIAALTAFAILMGAAVLRKFQGEFPPSAIAVLFSLCIAASAGAALLGIYPLGDIRQNLYLGPVIFLASGGAIHWIAGSLHALTRRAWMAPALTIAAAVAIALAGVAAIRQDSPYDTDRNIEAVLAALEERVREEDAVFAVHWAIPPIQFYRGEEKIPAQLLLLWDRWCFPSAEPGLRPCLREMIDRVALFPNVPDRIFLVYTKISILEELELLGEQVSVERVAADDGDFRIALIENIKASSELAARPGWETLVSAEPAIRSTFDVYLNENTLTYVKESCVRADTEARFSLHLYPVDLNDLPDHRRQHEFDNLNFNFNERGARFHGKCIARISLPEYDVATINTGQYVPVEGGYNHLWEGKIPIALIENVEAAVRSAEPVIRSDFDVYLSENTLTYVKESCVRADTEATFLLHLYPVDVNELPDRRKKHEFDNLDFDFNSRGVIFNGKCMARISLPEYDVATINTGQYVPVEGGYNHLWEGRIPIALIANVEAAVRSAEPIIRSTFDVYLSENTLTYVKDPCTRADTEATFLLHFYPVDLNDLPDRRKKHEFDNLDFDFNSRGAIFNGKCMARISLPEYDIATIGAGQYVPVEGGYNHLWEEEILFNQQVE